MANTKRQKVKETEPAKADLPANPVLKYEEEHFVDSTKPVWNYSLFSDEDITNFKNGTLYNAYKIMASHFFEAII